MKIPAPAAAVLAKANTLADFHPKLLAAALLIGGGILACDGLRRRTPADRNTPLIAA